MLDRFDRAPVAAQQIDKVLGASALGGIASRLGLGHAAVSTALGYAVPKLIGLLTPNGAIPTSLPAEVTKLLTAGATAQVAPSSVHVYNAPDKTAQVAPKRVDVYAQKKPEGLPGWLWPALGALVVLGLGWWLWPRPAVQPPVATAPVTAPAPVATTAAVATPASVATPAPAVAPAPAAAPILPSTLTLNNENGVVHYAGVVHDDQTRASILDALKAAYGADKIAGDISVDANRRVRMTEPGSDFRGEAGGLEQVQEPADPSLRAGDQRERFAHQRVCVGAEPKPLGHIVDKSVEYCHVCFLPVCLALGPADVGFQRRRAGER